jgi:RNA polymerase sigma factor (sigma-70 family)
VNTAAEQYALELSKPQYNPLPYEVERDYLVRFKVGELKLRDELILHNLRFVASIAKEFGVTDHRVDPLDLIQEGNYGLIYSIPRFDVTRTCRLCSYALHWIKFFIRTLVVSKDFKFTVLQEEYPDVAEEVQDIYHPAKKDLEEFLRERMTPSEAYILIQHFCTFDKHKVKNLEEIAVELRCTAMNVLWLRRTGLEKLQAAKEEFFAFIQEEDRKDASV